MAATQTTLTLDQIREGALALPTDQRHELADALSVSFDLPGDFLLSPEWDSELDRRSEDIWSGKVKSTPHEEVMRHLDDLVDGL